jgi:predicted SnoaL-like aldol condensation-catalyzing enzyme
MMSAEENKAAFRRIPEEVLNSGNPDLADEFFASDYIEHQPNPPGWPSGLEGFKAWVTLLHSAFPDVHYTVENVLAEGEMTSWPPYGARYPPRRVSGHRSHRQRGDVDGDPCRMV